MEQEDTRSHRLPRNHFDIGDEDNEEGNAPVHQTVEACGICQVPDDGQLQKCTVCSHHFHAACSGGDDLARTDSPKKGRKQKWVYHCDECNEEMKTIRYKCVNQACQDNDYCSGCQRTKAAEHGRDMARQGADSNAHGFIVVVDDFKDALAFNIDAVQHDFVCSDCKSRSRTEKLAKQIFAKKTVRDIRQESRKAKKTREDGMKEVGTRAAVEKRIADKGRMTGITSAGISKRGPRSSARLAGDSNGMGSLRTSHMLKLNLKKAAHLQTLVEGAKMTDVADEDDGIGAEDVTNDAELFGW